ncbi:hypothetical protein LXA43DRAFT_875771 [Ganoderma leucocontextum]|nr:hypothetical protein LXA43DRAFT_875771 [Ganoderma leucocontextum]
MLGRSRTESSIISISSTTEQDASEPNSIPATPKKLRTFASDSTIDSPSSQSPLRAKSSDDVSSPPIGVRPSLANMNSNVRTYAGKSRSFLVALPPSQAASIGIDATAAIVDSAAMVADSQEDDFEIRESYTELRQRWGIDGSEDDHRPASPHRSPSPKRKGKGKGLPKQLPVQPARLFNGMINDLKSITDLRSQGESRRFLDEVGYLFEGLEGRCTIGVRRASALEIVTKLCDVDFARKAKAADFLGRAWEVLRESGAGDGDKVLDTILAFYAALVARDSTVLSDLVLKSDFTGTLHNMLTCLELSNDPLWLISTNAGPGELKASGISKVENVLLGNLQRLVRKKSGIFDDSDIVSNRLLISHGLAVVSPSAHTFAHLPALLHTLTVEISLLPSRVAAYISGLSLFPPQGPSSYVETPSLLHLDDCLRLLDTCLLGLWSISGEDEDARAQKLIELREGGFAAGLIALCVSCNTILHDNSLKEHRQTATKCAETVLRVLINLTHEDLPWCRAVLDDDLSMPAIMHIIVTAQRQRRLLEKRVDADEGDSDHAETAARSLDRLCLALGLLTNLVQATPDARHLIGDTLLDFDCPNQRRCIRGCTCPSRASALACLAQVYAHYLKSPSELDAVVRGHMAVLFGLLMNKAPSNRHTLLAALPGEGDRAKLGTLLQHAQDFTLFYVALTRKMAESQETAPEDEEEEDSSACPSATVSRRVFQDSKGEAVAKGVIAFLKKLRDESR